MREKGERGVRDRNRDGYHHRWSPHRSSTLQEIKHGGVGSFARAAETGEEEGEWTWVSHRRRKATRLVRIGQADSRHINGYNDRFSSRNHDWEWRDKDCFADFKHRYDSRCTHNSHGGWARSIARGRSRVRRLDCSGHGVIGPVVDDGKFGSQGAEKLLFVDLKRGLEVCGIMEDVYVSRYRNSYGQRFGFVKYQKVRDVMKLQKALNSVYFWDLRLFANVARFDRFEGQGREIGNGGLSGVGDVGEGGYNNVQEKVLKRVAVDVVRLRTIDLEKGTDEAIISEEDRERERAVIVGEVVCSERKEPRVKVGDCAGVEEVVEEVVVVSDEVKPTVPAWKYLSLREDVNWASKCRLARLKQGWCFSVVQQSILDAGLEGLRLIAMGGDRVLIHQESDGSVENLFQDAAAILNNFLEDCKPWVMGDGCVYERGAWLRCYEEINTSISVLIDNIITYIRVVEDLEFGLAADACMVECDEDNRSQFSAHTGIPEENELVDTFVQQVHDDWISKPEAANSGTSGTGGEAANNTLQVPNNSMLGPFLHSEIRVSKSISAGRNSQGSKNSRHLKRNRVGSSIKILKRIARLSSEERSVLIRSLKKSRRRNVASKSSSRQTQDTSLSANSGNPGKSATSNDWKNWVALHGDDKQVQDDIHELGDSIGVVCHNSFKVLAKGSRGLGAVEKRRELRRLVSDKKVDILCIQESKLEVVEDRLARSIWGSDDVEYSFKPSVGASGGIVTMWNPKVVDVWSTTCLSSCLIIQGKFYKDDLAFCLANVYAPCDARGRSLLWRELDVKLLQIPLSVWCVLGDFNAIRSRDERVSRGSSGVEDYMAFKNFIDRNALIDLPLGGRSFTWYSGDGLSMSRLDRFLISDSWVFSFPHCVQMALPRSLSDHCPIMLSVDVQDWGPKPFRMMKCWADISGYAEFVKQKWQSFQIHGWSGHILKTKLKLLKAELRSWHQIHTANLDGKIQRDKSRLEELDICKEGRGLDVVEEAELLSLPVDILALSKLQASMYWQKSRVTWLREGDANSKFFHGVMSSRRRANSIGALIHAGRTVESVPEVRHIVYQHYSNHFRKQMHYRPDISRLEFRSLSSLHGAELTKPFLMEEIKAAVWDCDSFKCPGPDGINIGFFKDFWDLLKVDLLNFFSDFHHNGVLTKGLNSTFIALIPKVENPLKVTDFRPIALVSSIYKILSKVLANRLRNVVGVVVSDAQSAFIKGRQILDGILIANELVDDAKRNSKDLLLFKVDFEKAYDSVDWDYLDEVMVKMNFPSQWRVWMKACVMTASASVLVNGSPTAEFCFERGLRQGDPLSPFLFLLAAEGLNVLMTALVRNGSFTPYEVGSHNSVRVSHLQFADDTLLVGVKSWANVRALKAVLLLFENISGLKVNFHKSMLFGVNVNNSWLHEAASVMRCKHGCLPFLYLGLPIGGDSRRIQFWKPLLDKIHKRLENGGLGVRRVKDFNYALLGKWVWRCFAEGDSLWCQLLKAKYGQDSAGRVRFSEGVGSSWWRALNFVWSGRGLIDPRWLSDNIVRKIGDGRSTAFWADSWLEVGPLARAFGRLYDLADNKHISVADMFEAGWELNGNGWKWRRRWVWNLHPSQSYSVRSAYSYLTASDGSSMEDFASFLWVKSVPLKVNIFIWRLFLNRLPTKDNLLRRGIIEVHQELCSTNCGKAEDAVHLFIQCDVYSQVWHLVLNWLGLSTALHVSLGGHAEQFAGPE
ncbi:hypothetical protein TSUD_152630 [Trifolium subterraneum]|uniref:Reverse transcriptase domain-containing protein n=1 Tax=Trifolium subterraneum TaxID=3900 RepID=A0A2Z6MSZ6_TRISU|nr:hypothetical protein TSUD_152630 [Trifolium subterraneum]